MAAETHHHQVQEPFEIHEDVRTEDTEMMPEEERTEEAVPPTEEAEQQYHQQGHQVQQHQQQHFEEEDEEEMVDETSEDEAVDRTVQADMDKLQGDFPGFRNKYRLIKRIGEGTFSTVYKAEDIMYDHYDNSWDIDDDSSKWTPPPLKRNTSQASRSPRRKARYVAIKKIYVTSSPSRILNEIELLNDLRLCPSVCPLITAFRHTDQVVAILPYFRHGDFRAYFRDMTIPDIAIYLRSLFTALKSVHENKILHRDIKPTNFLYDPATQRGVLVDFGLAEREGSDCKPCLCHETRETRKHRQANSVWAQNSTNPQVGYPKSDTRSSRRANRAGTRGFRAPEVLFKCTEQTTSIDIWSAGVILLTIMSKRFPFFNSADDVEAMIEIATIFGTKRMKAAALLHGCAFETSIPTVGQQGFSMEKIILWSTCRTDDKPLTPDEKLAVRFLERCMELDPSRRITAEQALEHEFLRVDALASQELGDEDEMDMLHA
ncbi:serine/threonine protein kinase Hsk1 [Dactylonectria macrodidyma]|uniref:non-specific serine/threonine protein kinase n=1 Tax=Dactylonectria macrodidyma TaxID=307937 RepID=A0A9P9II60_9HYPO|nr:serine/threonine protein kinase Hsk1 [Dactylonectria macrodidyma]